MRTLRVCLVVSLAVVFAASVPSASAGWQDIFKKSVQSPSTKGSKGNKTENLITGGLGVLQSLQPIGYKEEMAIGGAVALEAVARFGGLFEDAALEKYLATVGKAVALTSDRPDIPYYFGILNTEEANAFACPGGYVFVSRGFLKLAKNEAQLAGVLGHEISHITKRHALESIRRSKMLGSVSEVTLTALDQDPKIFDAIVKETVSLILERGYNQATEFESDALGTDYAFRVGYNPTGLESFLKILAGTQKGHKSGVYKTHPDTTDRVHKLAVLLKKPEFVSVSSLPLLSERLAQNLSNVKL